MARTASWSCVSRRAKPGFRGYSCRCGLAEMAEVRHAERLFGDPDYLIRVATADLAAYQELRDEKLAALPGVQRLSSTIVMKRIVEDRPYPVAPSSGSRR